MTTKTQQIRQWLIDGNQGSARTIAGDLGFNRDTTSTILSRMEIVNVAKVVDYDYTDTGHKVKVYAATDLTADPNMPSSEPYKKRMARKTRIHTEGLVGLRGIAVAVIADAVKDARNGCEDAQQWIGSRAYQWYMDYLDLNPDMLPVELS